ncbi:hypothetical protein KBC99_02300 [Candidatus Saccharibacteria bacterium]|nr:hypothetical protein [Candidatus Saccharibacteria bacterium]
MIERTFHTLKKLPHRVRNRLSHHLISPREILTDLGLAEGDAVLELGNPIGFFAGAALEIVGDPGRVVVAGPNNESLERIEHLTHRRQLETTLLADVLLGRAFEHHSVDWVILTNLLSSSLHPDQFCLAINQYIRSHGHVLVLDWDTTSQAGPLSERRVNREAAIRMLGNCGLEFERSIPTPGYHYGLVFTVKTP